MTKIGYHFHSLEMDTSFPTSPIQAKLGSRCSKESQKRMHIITIGVRSSGKKRRRHKVGNKASLTLTSEA